jgi:hypothetical protein
MTTPDPTNAPAYEPDQNRRTLQQLLARHAQLDADTRAALDALSHDEDRIALGGKTRAVGVLGEGVAWAVQIDQAFAQYPALTSAHYAQERFGYYLERLLGLDAAVELQTQKEKGLGGARSTTEQRETEAKAKRKVLLNKLMGFAGGRKDEKRELDAVVGTTESYTAIGQSVRDMVKLGRQWLARTDKYAVIQAKLARLTPALLDETLAAAEALTGSSVDSKLKGKSHPTDTPETNLAEGWFLFEFIEAHRCFEAAHADSALIAKLVPGPATRSLFNHPRHAAPDPAPTPAPADPKPKP